MLTRFHVFQIEPFKRSVSLPLSPFLTRKAISETPHLCGDSLTTKHRSFLKSLSPLIETKEAREDVEVDEAEALYALFFCAPCLVPWMTDTLDFDARDYGLELSGQVAEGVRALLNYHSIQRKKDKKNKKKNNAILDQERDQGRMLGPVIDPVWSKERAEELQKEEVKPQSPLSFR